MSNMEEIFDKVSKNYDLFLNSISLSKINTWQKFILSYSLDGPFLDVGTGTGSAIINLTKVYKNFPIAIGIDLSRNMLKKAIKKVLNENIKNAYFINSSVYDLPFKNDTFKTVNTSLVFRHLSDRERALKEINRVLAPKGRFLVLDVAKVFGTDFLVKASDSLLKPIGLKLFGKDNWEFFKHSLQNSYSPNELSKIVESFGFKELKRKTFLVGTVMAFVFEKI